jgi:hypothetical protein
MELAAIPAYSPRSICFKPLATSAMPPRRAARRHHHRLPTPRPPDWASLAGFFTGPSGAILPPVHRGNASAHHRVAGLCRRSGPDWIAGTRSWCSIDCASAPRASRALPGPPCLHLPQRVLDIPKGGPTAPLASPFSPRCAPRCLWARITACSRSGTSACLHGVLSEPRPSRPRPTPPRWDAAGLAARQLRWVLGRNPFPRAP